MAQKKYQPKNRQIGKTKVPEKKPLIDPKYKNTVWTIIIIVILAIFFIINNTRPVPDHGSYPPGFNPQSAEKFLHQNK